MPDDKASEYKKNYKSCIANRETCILNALNSRIQLKLITMYRAQDPTSRRTIITAIIYWFFTFIYMGIIFYLSSLSNIDLNNFPENFDRVVHACVYFLLALLIYLSLNKSGTKRYVFILAFLISVLYGISDEFHQSFVPGRDASVYDLLADALGALLGSFFAHKVSL